MVIKVGIDLGTTFSAVAFINPKTGAPEMIHSDKFSTTPITPSAVQITADGRIICGTEAKMAFNDSEADVATAFKRNMGSDTACFVAADGSSYTAEQLSTMLLRFLKEQAEQSLSEQFGEPVTIEEAVITVPAYFEDGPRSATRRAAQAAGLKVKDIISEPTAAALNYGLSHWRENAKILVYDLGGGTFDVTVVGMDSTFTLHTIGTLGEHLRGGRDWDNRLVDLAIDKLRTETGEDIRSDLALLSSLQSAAEGWKIALSTRPGVDVKQHIDGYGLAEIRVTREEFDAATRDLLEQTGALCDQLLDSLGLKWSELTDVLLVGGSTRMPQIKEYLTARTGKAPITHVHPDQAVAIGAAMRANMNRRAAVLDLGREQNHRQALLSSMSGPVGRSTPVCLEQMSFQDAVAHAMGIVLINQERTAYVNETVIPANSPAPCKFAVPTVFDTRAPQMDIYVVQGSGDLATAQFNAKYVVTGFRKAPGGKTNMRVQYSYDSNQLINVQVRQENDTTDLPIRKEPFTPEEIARFLRPYEPTAEEEVIPRTIIMAVDVSGSMSGDPLSNAKRDMSNFARQYVGDNVRVGVIAVSDRAQWIIHPTDDIHAVIRAIDSITSCMTGVCNAAHPFGLIRDELAGSTEECYAIILADGVWERQHVAIKAAKECHSAGIEVAAIGFGTADQQFLDAISSQKDLSFMTDHTRLGASFSKIAQRIGSGSNASTMAGGARTSGHAPRARLLSSLLGKKSAVPSAQTWDLPGE